MAAKVTGRDKSRRGSRVAPNVAELRTSRPSKARSWGFGGLPRLVRKSFPPTGPRRLLLVFLPLSPRLFSFHSFFPLFTALARLPSLPPFHAPFFSRAFPFSTFLASLACSSSAPSSPDDACAACGADRVDGEHAQVTGRDKSRRGSRSLAGRAERAEKSRRGGASDFFIFPLRGVVL